MTNQMASTLPHNGKIIALAILITTAKHIF